MVFCKIPIVIRVSAIEDFDLERLLLFIHLEEGD